MWLPDWLYRALPNLYGMAGLITVYKFKTPLGIFSGVLLIITAVLIWMMRPDYRQRQTSGVKKRYR